MNTCDGDGERHLGFEIRRLSNLFKRNIDRAAAQVLPGESTGIQVWMLGYIARESETNDVFQRDIEKRFNVRRASATGMLQLMEKNGMITRESVPYDARLKKIVLTERGGAAAAEMKNMLDRFERELREDVGDEDLAVFYRVVDKIRSKMEGRDPDALLHYS